LWPWKKILNLQYLDNGFQQVAKTIGGFSKVFLLFSLDYSQTWLIPLVDDCQCGYIKKLKKQKKKTLNKLNYSKSQKCNNSDSKKWFI
jgi:hypothetical protein